MSHHDVALDALHKLALVLLIIQLMQIHQAEANVHQLAIPNVLMHPHNCIIECPLGTT